jgi:putative mRNA 3-end processing factor
MGAMAKGLKPEDWLKVTPAGLYCAPGDFYVDPVRRVDRAVITHGHGDHARPGNKRVLATPETIEIMKTRFGDDAGRNLQDHGYSDAFALGDVTLRFVPAGHVLGSAQVVIEHASQRVVVSGDYKRTPDPTCPPFEPVACDVFITEATFALPVFRHADATTEIAKVLAAQALFPERAVLVGAYGLGKCQRVIALLRMAGYDRPIWLHGAQRNLCDLYQRLCVDLGDLRDVAETDKDSLAGEIILAPPGALNDRWSRRLPEPLTAMASGWMRVRARARQRGIELPLVISDHADWDELTQTLKDVDAPEVWVTHGREEALVHWAENQGIRARALSLIGREDEDD